MSDYIEIYISIGENYRVLDCSSTQGDNRIKIEVEKDHEVLLNPFIFTYDNGELIKDVEYQQQLIDEVRSQRKQPTLLERVNQLQLENEELKNDNLKIMEIIAGMYETNLT